MYLKGNHAWGIFESRSGSTQVDSSVSKLPYKSTRLSLLWIPHIQAEQGSRGGEENIFLPVPHLLSHFFSRHIFFHTAITSKSCSLVFPSMPCPSSPWDRLLRRHSLRQFKKLIHGLNSVLASVEFSLFSEATFSSEYDSLSRTRKDLCFSSDVTRLL